jgi:hypothetical protein
MRENGVADPGFSSTDLPSKDLFKPFKTSASRLCFGCISVVFWWEQPAASIARVRADGIVDRREIAGIASTMWTRSA